MNANAYNRIQVIFILFLNQSKNVIIVYTIELLFKQYLNTTLIYSMLF